MDVDLTDPAKELSNKDEDADEVAEREQDTLKAGVTVRLEIFVFDLPKRLFLKCERGGECVAGGISRLNFGTWT